MAWPPGELSATGTGAARSTGRAAPSGDGPGARRRVNLRAFLAFFRPRLSVGLFTRATYKSCSQRPFRGYSMGQISTRLIVIALLSVTAMSLVPVLIRFTSANIETIGTARLAISLVALTPLVLFTGQLRRPTRGDWGWLMAAGLCFGLHWWTYFYAIKSAGAAAGAIAMSTFGIHLLLLNRIVHRHPVRLLDGLMVALCIVGCYLVV